jgi:tetratricopeptide (TPR) repeat protein
MLILSPRLRALSPAERDRYESIAETYEAMLDGAPPDLEPFLPVEQPLRTLVLVHLARCDLEQRKKRGMPICVEDYLRRFTPELAGDDDACLELVIWERQYGSEEDVEALVKRFPKLDARLRELLPRLRPTDVPPQVKGYEILEELGRGGMGVVYKARQTQLRRLVALKMLRRGAHPMTDEADRFRREAQLVAALHHTHIVEVYDYAGDGEPYLAMMLCPGGSLAEREKPMAPRPAAELVAGLTDAVAYAHAQGIIHRDLKPANVLFDSEGNPRVSDFGLVKQLGPDAREPILTQTGAIVGTPSFMAPEQASSGLTEVGPAADVWALGAILYELLTDRPPFRAASTFETLEQVIHLEPASPRSLNPAVPRDLETICLKCLQKEPRKRYASAKELADDLRRFINGRPITARPVGVAELTVKWARRRPAVAALLCLSVLALLALVLGGLWYNRQLQDTADWAIKGWQEAENRRVEAERETARANRLAIAAQDRLKMTREVLNRFATRVSEDPRLRQHDLEHLRRDLLAPTLPLYQTLVRQHPDLPELLEDQAAAVYYLAMVTREVRSGREALPLLRQARDLFGRLLRQQPNVPSHCTSLAACHVSVGIIEAMSGPVTGEDRAEIEWKEACRILEPLVQTHPENAEYNTHLRMPLRYLKYLYERRGDRKQAEVVSKRLGDLNAKLESDPEQKQLDARLKELAKITKLNTPELRARAFTAFQRIRAALDDLAGKRFDDPDWQQLIASRYLTLIETLGILPVVAVTGGDLSEILATEASVNEEIEVTFGKVLALCNCLARDHPHLHQYQSQVSAIHSAAGMQALTSDRHADARFHFERALVVQGKLVQEHPAEQEYRFGLHMVYCGLADLEATRNQDRTALQFQERAREQLRFLLEKHPGDRRFTEALKRLEAPPRPVVSLRSKILGEADPLRIPTVALVALLDDQPTEASVRLERALLADAKDTAPQRNAVATLALSAARLNLGTLLARQGKFREARTWYDRGLSSLEPLLAHAQDKELVRRAFVQGSKARALLLLLQNQYAAALDDLDRALKWMDGNKVELRLRRAIVLAYLGRHAQATDEVKDALPWFGATASMRIDAARAEAVASATVLRDTNLEEAKRRTKSDGYARSAIERLTVCERMGAFRDPHLRTVLERAKDLDALRNRHEFNSLLERVRKEGR